MTRILGLGLVVVLWLCSSSTTTAQTAMADGSGYGYGYGGYDHGVPSLETQAIYGQGGYGHEYTQGPPASGVLMNRWGQVIGEAYPAAGSYITNEPTNARITSTTTSPGRPRFLRRYAVTTGSLGWSAANGAGVYRPAIRQGTFGGGYALSPYGTVNYYGGFRGYTLGN